MKQKETNQAGKKTDNIKEAKQKQEGKKKEKREREREMERETEKGE